MLMVSQATIDPILIIITIKELNGLSTINNSKIQQQINTVFKDKSITQKIKYIFSKENLTLLKPILPRKDKIISKVSKKIKQSKVDANKIDKNTEIWLLFVNLSLLAKNQQNNNQVNYQQTHLKLVNLPLNPELNFNQNLSTLPKTTMLKKGHFLIRSVF